MSVDAKHPLYADFITDWRQMRATYRGERVVKAAGFEYLPATSGMIEDGVQATTQPGWKAYDAYRKRARFPEFVSDAIETMIGIMHRKPATIELPESMEYMRESATAKNESLAHLLRRVNEEQLALGRVGLLGDVIDAGDRTGETYISLYQGEHIINWDEGDFDDLEPETINLVVLDETGTVRQQDFEWQTRQKFRVLILGDPLANEPVGGAVYEVGTFEEDTDSGLAFSPDRMITPTIRGASLTRIPFVFVNGKDIVPKPDDPPLMGLSNLALSVYRQSADYYQALFMQGQDTLVLIGTRVEAKPGEPVRTGANATIELAPGQGVDAKFIGVDSQGITEMRESLQNDRTEASSKAGELLDTTSRMKESGEALQTRIAAKTATLTQVARAGAEALQKILRILAEWQGANPDQVIVEPNLEFAQDPMVAAELSQLMGAKMLGAPLSLRTIHENMQEKGLTTRTLEEEAEEMSRENELGFQPTDPTGREDPEEDEEEEEETEEETEPGADEQ